MIASSPLVMECRVDDVYETEGFESFICKIDHTYAEENILNEKGKIDYSELPLFSSRFPSASFFSTVSYMYCKPTSAPARRRFCVLT